MSFHPDIDKLPLETDGIRVRETIREIFRNPENGAPDNISKAGCLALAIKSNEVGREAGDDKTHVLWNAWCERFAPGGSGLNPLDFSEVDFRKSPNTKISFDLMRCGAVANFSGAKFGGTANFRAAKFGFADFSGAQFGGKADFGAAEFFMAAFKAAKFDGSAFFRGAKFDYVGDFRTANFVGNADFRVSQFGGYATFFASQFKQAAEFTAAQFGGCANFSAAQFAEVCFRGAQFGGQANFKAVQFSKWVNFQAATWEELKGIDDEKLEVVEKCADTQGLAPNLFHRVDFSGAQFAGRVNFSNRQFLATTQFGCLSENFFRSQDVTLQLSPIWEITVGMHESKFDFSNFRASHGLLHVVFGVAPVFHGCKLHQDTSFEGAEFPRPCGEEAAASAYRTLKLAFAQQQAIREEQLFFRIEMDEEGVGHRIKGRDAVRKSQLFLSLREYGTWLLYWLYRQASDYGFSIARPLLLLAFFWLIFAQIYGSYTSVKPCYTWAENCQVQSDWLNYSLQQALPLPGFDKLEHAVKGVSVAWLVFHKTLSLSALFLIGLALRNLFKLR